MKKPDHSKPQATKQADLKPPTYQPSKQELEQEFDMPGADMKTLRKAFFNPQEQKRKK